MGSRANIGIKHQNAKNEKDWIKQKDIMGKIRGRTDMANFRCKICGELLEVQQGQTVGVCPNCGSQQTLPRLESEKKQSLYERAGFFRQHGEYEKAVRIYHEIFRMDNTDPEVYWSILLCRYGVEYVKISENGQWMPLLNRTQNIAIFTTAEYQKAIQYANEPQKKIYALEAKKIDAIQQRIYALARKDPAVDVYLCYQDKDEEGKETRESILATQLADGLKNAGYQVYTSQVSQKMRSASEPHIFAALNSAQVMVVVGTKLENFNATWVKNQWSRYLEMIQAGAKKTLIPAYGEISLGELPEEFLTLTAQDMEKPEWVPKLVAKIQSLIVKRVVQQPSEDEEAAKPSVESLLKRGQMFLEDGNWQSAGAYFERVLDINPEYAPAYVGKLCALLRVKKESQLADAPVPLNRYGEYARAIQFADWEYRNTLEGYNRQIINHQEHGQKEAIYQKAKEKYDSGKARKMRQASGMFASVVGYRDADTLAAACDERVQQLKKGSAKKRGIWAITTAGVVFLMAVVIVLTAVVVPDSKYRSAVTAMNQGEYKKAGSIFAQITDYKDSEDQLYQCAMGVYLAGDTDGALEMLKLINDDQTANAQISWFLEKRQNDVPEWNSIAAGKYHTAAVLENGKVVATGFNEYFQCHTSTWEDIVCVTVGKDHTIGLTRDGGLIAAGRNEDEQCSIAGWSDIKEIDAGQYHTVGLEKKSTVMATGNNDYGQCNVNGWKDMVDIAAGDNHTVGLRANGTVATTGDNTYGQCDVKDWDGIIAIAAGGNATIGLKLDGTIVVAGEHAQDYHMEDWTDIIAISIGADHVVGLKEDGTVLATGGNEYGQCDVSDWQNIIGIAAGDGFTIGLKEDGTAVTVGNNEDGQCDVSEWMDMKRSYEYEEE